ncbi:MAG: hypothetical protein D6797_03385 [Bdellovibrio sp.]|nr:MAG: hypothetical protein D6797_03385 [Bdellovibrio sp.]
MQATKINYELLEKAREQKVQTDLRSELKKHLNQHQVHGLRQTILQQVVTANYEAAQRELDHYVDSLDEYPAFRPRTERYVRHAKDLINAIKSKRNFPGLSSLSKSKQQELIEKVLEHFDELKEYLKRLEKVERELKLEDMRSTVIVVKAFFHILFILVTIAFVNELLSGTGHTFSKVISDISNKLMELTMSLF